MKIVEERPGRRLVLQAPEVEVPPASLVTGLAVIGVSIWWSLRTFRQMEAAVAFEALFLAALGWAGFRRARRTRALRLIVADREAGSLRIVERGVFGWFSRDQSLALRDLQAVRVRHVQNRGPASAGPAGLALELELVSNGSRGSTSRDRLDLLVENLDQRNEVADFALRLGASAGLGFHQVVRNDPGGVEILLTNTYAEGMDQIPSFERPADYARDLVSPVARDALSEEVVPPFDPRAFPSDHRVKVWEPGREVRLRRPMSLGAIVCVPVAAAPLLAWLFLRDILDPSGLGPGPALILFVLVALVTVVGVVGVLSGLPREVVFDWVERSLLIRRPWRTRCIGFQELAKIELRGVHRVLRSKNSVSHVYHCEVRVHRSDPAMGTSLSETIVRTRTLPDDPDTPYRHTLSLATALSRALNVERLIVDYQ